MMMKPKETIKKYRLVKIGSFAKSKAVRAKTMDATKVLRKYSVMTTTLFIKFASKKSYWVNLNSVDLRHQFCAKSTKRTATFNDRVNHLLKNEEPPKSDEEDGRGKVGRCYKDLEEEFLRGLSCSIDRGKNV